MSTSSWAFPAFVPLAGGAGVLVPGQLGEHEGAGDHVEPAIAVHVQEVLAVVLHVVGAEGEDLAQRALDKLRSLVPKLPGGDVGVAVLVDVADGATLVVVDVQLLHRKLHLWWLRLRPFFRRLCLRQYGESEPEDEPGWGDEGERGAGASFH